MSQREQEMLRVWGIPDGPDRCDNINGVEWARDAG